MVEDSTFFEDLKESEDISDQLKWVIVPKRLSDILIKDHGLNESHVQEIEFYND